MDRDTSPRLSPAERTARTLTIQGVEGELGMAVARLREKHGLTRLEMLSILAGVMSIVAAFGIRKEWGGE